MNDYEECISLLSIFFSIKTAESNNSTDNVIFDDIRNNILTTIFISNGFTEKEAIILCLSNIV